MKITEFGLRTALPDRLRTKWALVVILAGVLVVGLTWWYAGRSQPPVDARSLQLSVSLRAVGADELTAAQNAMAGSGGVRSEILPTPKVGTYVVGQLWWTRPAEQIDEGRLHLLVIDKRNDRAMQVWPTSWSEDEPAAGWEGWYDKVGRQYGWLSAIRAIELESGAGFTDVGQSVIVPVNSTGPLTFVALPDYNPLVYGAELPEPQPLPDPRRDLLVVVLGSGDFGDFWWAERVPVADS